METSNSEQLNVLQEAARQPPTILGLSVKTRTASKKQSAGTAWLQKPGTRTLPQIWQICL